MCVVYLKQEKWDRVSKFCKEILAVEDGGLKVGPTDIKHAYRFALAKVRQGDHTSAREAIDKVLHLEPNNTDVT